MDESTTVAMSILGAIIALLIIAAVMHARESAPVTPRGTPYLPVSLNPPAATAV